MLVLALLDAVFAVVSGIANIVLPALPQQLDTIIVYIFQLIQDGLSILFTFFFDASILAPIVSWVLNVYLTFFTIDLVWRIIDIIKLRRSAA